jgi:hypothetical protein
MLPFTRHAIELAPRVARVDAVDFAPHMLEHLERQRRALDLDNVRIRPFTHEVRVESAEQFWDVTTRSSAPLVLLKNRLGVSEWQRQSEHVRVHSVRSTGSHWNCAAHRTLLSEIAGTLAHSAPRHARSPLNDACRRRPRAANAWFSMHGLNRSSMTERDPLDREAEC